MQSRTLGVTAGILGFTGVATGAFAAHALEGRIDAHHLEIFQTGVNGKLVQKGASPLVGRLGDTMLDERVSLWDDATLDYGECGQVPYENARVRFSATSAELRPCPTLGQDNPMILSEILGLDDDAITELVIAGVIQ